MSGEYISREAFSEVLETAIKMQELAMKMLDAEDDPELQMSLKVYNDILNGIKEFPAADVAEVRHGRWGHRWICSNMTGYEYACSCSECNKATYRISTLEPMPLYCPRCGAKMDGGQDE